MRRATELAASLVLLLGCPEPLPVLPPPGPVQAHSPQLAAITPLDAGPANDAAGAVVLSIGGEVQIRREGSQEWIALSIGDKIHVGDRVRTTGDGQLALSFDMTKIRVHEDSQVTIDALDPSQVRISVTGAGEAELPDGKGQVSFAAGGAVASSTGGRLALAFDGKNVVASALSGSAT